MNRTFLARVFIVVTGQSINQAPGDHTTKTFCDSELYMQCFVFLSLSHWSCYIHQVKRGLKLVPSSNVQTTFSIFIHWWRSVIRHVGAKLGKRCNVQRKRFFCSLSEKLLMTLADARPCRADTEQHQVQWSGRWVWKRGMTFWTNSFPESKNFP